jgi:mercuric reductase
MDTISLPVEGMTCAHCERTVEAALAEAGATDARADFLRGVVTFDFDGDPAPAVEAVRAAGYHPGAPSRPVVASPDGQRHASGGGKARFDLVTIGSGSAAFAAAIRATNLGARVAMVEAGTVGGTCVNVGCIPSKALLAAAETYHRAGAHPFAGITTRAAGVDMAALVSGKDDIVATLRHEKYLDLATDYGFEIISGHAAFSGPDRLAVDGRELTADTFLIATGAAPFIPTIPGLAEAGYLTSTTAMTLDHLPESVVVIGGNYIGLEMGQLFADLGVGVTIVEALDRLAPNEEPEVSAWITQVLVDQGVEVITSASVLRVETGNPKSLAVEVGGSRRRIEATEILVATGRRPVLDGLGLDAAGIGLDDRGGLLLDDELCTTNPKVYAAGDVTGEAQFVYVAAAQGTVAADNAVGGAARKMDYSALPRVTFTTPGIAGVGMTEAQAEAAGYDCDCRVLELANVPRARVNRDIRGGVKVVAERHSGRVLGLSAVAEGAGELILAGVYAVKFGLTVADLADTWAPYLTMAEAVKLAAQTYTVDVSKLSCCAA